MGASLSKEGRIKIMLSIDILFFFLELGVGLAVGSLALMADAFHMLNDIISLLVGLWAVKAAQKRSTDKYSFGYLRAEILGAFFNAVFLIALCITICLDAFTRLVDPPTISSPQLILIVGGLGLASNLGGFIVLGGHGHSHGSEDEHSLGSEDGHSHGPEGHSYGDGIQHAEEGHAHGPEGHSHSAKAKSKTTQRIRFTESGEDVSRDSADSLARSTSKVSNRSNKHRRRTSGHFTSIEERSFYPASFREGIIAASKVDGADEESSAGEESVAADNEEAPTEASPLLTKSNGSGVSIGHSSHDHSHDHGHEDHGDEAHDHEHDHTHNSQKRHAEHNHNKPKKPSSGGHSHNHADMGMNAMILHVIGDALGNVGVIVAALVIWLTEWSGRYYADPAVSLFITLIILKSTIPLTLAAGRILLQATPDHIDVNDIRDDIEHIDGVLSCHHIHIWQLSDTQIVASMHMQVEFGISEASGEKYMSLAKEARECLHAYGIHSATIQPEFCLDKDHDHVEGRMIPGVDGPAGAVRCGKESDGCLLECVDDCTGKGCCSTSASDPSAHDHSDHSDHSH